MRSEERTGVLAAVAATGLTAAAYIPGIGRSLTYDAGETVGFFILPGTPFDALRAQRAFNNHPLFSFLESILVHATGRSDEWLLRILPIAFAASAVGALVWAVHRRLGLAPALAAATILATNPMFVEHGRSVRGYSLLVLAAIVATDLFLELLDRPSRNLSIGYVVVVTVGMLTHLFMAPVLLAHAVELARRRALDRRWVITFLTLGVLSGVFYARMLDDLLSAGESRGRIFQPTFPWDLAVELLGHEVVAVVSLGAITAIGLRRLVRQPPTPAFAAVIVVVIVVAWFAAPENLAPRFFVWLVPAVAVIGATTVSSIRTAIPVGLIAIGALASVVGVADGYTAPRNAYPEIAAIVDRADERGDLVCVSDLSVPPMLAYTRAFSAVVDPVDLAQCDVVAIVEPQLDDEYVDVASERFDHRIDFDRQDPGIVFSSEPIPAG